MTDLSIVIPAYNERHRLPPTLEAVLDWVANRPESVEVIVVDDGSTDDTSAVASRYPVRVLRLPANAGKGAAVRAGVLESRGRRVLFMDADLATPIEEYDKLSSALDSGFSVAIGSRPLADSQLEVRQPWLREMAGRAFNGVVRLLAVPGIRDTQCGFKLFDGAVARWIFSRCSVDGFGFDVELLHIATRCGIGVREVPVRWAHQEGAVAFSSPARYLRHGLRMLRDIVHIRHLHRGLRPGSCELVVSRP